MRRADMVITGEGRLDAQTLEGKAPAGVARLAEAAASQSMRSWVNSSGRRRCEICLNPFRSYERPSRARSDDETAPASARMRARSGCRLCARRCA